VTHRTEEEPVSPGSAGTDALSYFTSSPYPPPKDLGPKTAPSRDHRREDSGADDIAIPIIQHQPPSAPLAQIAPWAEPSSAMPSSAMLPPAKGFNFFGEQGGESLQTSPMPRRPMTSRTETSESMDSPWRMQYDDERRPSVASSGTIGSQESQLKTGSSKASLGKKIGGFFAGDEGSGRSTRQASELNLSRQTTRSGSTPIGFDGRPVSPGNSRPRTPQAAPSSDVAPWVFQDFEVCLGKMLLRAQRILFMSHVRR
jgi:hypothetical protein